MTVTAFPPLIPELSRALAADHAVAGDVMVRPLRVSESATFVADGLAGGPRVIRVYRHGRHSNARIRSELQWIDALRQEDFETPGIIRTRTGELYSAFVGADGLKRIYVTFEYLKPDPVEVPLKRHLEAIGNAAGKLQEHARGWTPPAGFDRPRYDYSETLDPRTDWGSWPTRPLPTSARKLLTTAQDKVLHRLPSFSPEAVQLIHSDLKPVNSIWHAGKMFTIDFDDCGYAWPLFDLAASLTFHEADPQLSELIDCYLRGYERHRMPSNEELDLIASFVMQRRLMIFGWLGAHPHTDLQYDLDEVLAGTLEVAEKYLSGTLL